MVLPASCPCAYGVLLLYYVLPVADVTDVSACLTPPPTHPCLLVLVGVGCPSFPLQATREELRPTMPIGSSAASGAAVDCLGLDDLSECHGKTDVSKLEHDLGVSPGPPEAAAGSAAPTAVKEKGGAGEGGSGGSVVGIDTRADANGSASIAASTLTPASVPAATGGGGGGVPGGGVESVQAGGVRIHKPRKASFDGYDFNTLQKVGSIGVGRLTQGVPHLAAKRSSDFVKGRLP